MNDAWQFLIAALVIGGIPILILLGLLFGALCIWVLGRGAIAFFRGLSRGPNDSL